MILTGLTAAIAATVATVSVNDRRRLTRAN
jgi:hypothetical protein